MNNLLSITTDLFEKKKYSELIQLAEENNVYFDKDPYLHKFKAASLFCIGNYKDAFIILNSLESSFGESADFLSLYAATARCLGDLVKSKDLFLKALSVDPDSLQIQNNYSNLLIDLKEYYASKSILEKIVQIDPSYRDAVNNLDRIDSIIANLASVEVNNQAPFLRTSSLTLDDPLLFAFHDEEIDFSRKRYIDKYKSKLDVPFSDYSISPSIDSVALEQLEAAASALSENNSSLVLKLCSQVRVSLPLNSRVYEYASDAYLNMKLFKQAECCLLHSILLGGCSLKHFFNMVSFCRMRRDFTLASFYLGKAIDIDPTSEEVSKLKSTLDSDLVNQPNHFSFSSSWPDDKILKKNA